MSTADKFVTILYENYQLKMEKMADNFEKFKKDFSEEMEGKLEAANVLIGQQGEKLVELEKELLAEKDKNGVKSIDFEDRLKKVENQQDKMDDSNENLKKFILNNFKNFRKTIQNDRAKIKQELDQNDSQISEKLESFSQNLNEKEILIQKQADKIAENIIENDLKIGNFGKDLGVLKKVDENMSTEMAVLKETSDKHGDDLVELEELNYKTGQCSDKVTHFLTNCNYKKEYSNINLMNEPIKRKNIKLNFVDDDKPHWSNKQSFSFWSKKGVSAYKWFGFRMKSLNNKNIKISFNYKWKKGENEMKTLPKPTYNTGLKVFMKIDHKNWDADLFDPANFQKCSDNWCKFSLDVCVDYCGKIKCDDLVLLIFDTAVEEVEILLVGEDGVTWGCWESSRAVQSIFLS